MQWFRHEPLAQRAKDTMLYTTLLESVRARMSNSDAAKSIGTRALEKQANFGLTDVETAYALSAPFAAGVGSVSRNGLLCRIVLIDELIVCFRRWLSLMCSSVGGYSSRRYVAHTFCSAQSPCCITLRL